MFKPIYLTSLVLIYENNYENECMLCDCMFYVFILLIY